MNETVEDGYVEEWSQPSSQGERKRPKVVNDNPKNIVNHNQTRTLDSVTPVEEPVDFLSSEANDGLKLDLNALDSIVDIKPVTTFTIKNLHTSKIQKKPLLVLIDTGSERSVIKAAHSHHGIVKTGHTMKFRTPSGTFSSKKVTDTEFFLN